MIKSSPPICSFQIEGLFGDRDVTLLFKSPVKILIDENGAGKTTVINALFNILSGNWGKLSNLDFATMRLFFPNDKEIVIGHADLELSHSHFPVLDELVARLPTQDFRRLVYYEKPITRSALMERAENAANATGIPSQVIFNTIMEYREYRSSRHSSAKQALSPKLEELSSRLKELFPYPIMYFPTYRRVEEDLQNLGYIEKDLNRDERLIQFGMEDVNTRFKRITSEIRESSFEWYSRISGHMIEQFIDGLDAASMDYKSLENIEAVGIVLDRVGPNISVERKKHTLELIKSLEIKESRYQPLAYFLSNLLQVYDQQRNNDNAIKNFARVCNHYLEEKEVRYDESKITIQIISTRSGKEVLLNKLSSGEKQLISIFSRLFLDTPAEYAILFDEPELSLSMEWQKRLLQDIVDSSHCRFLLAATHSPFIFENSLDKFASTLEIHYKKGHRDSR